MKKPDRPGPHDDQMAWPAGEPSDEELPEDENEGEVEALEVDLLLASRAPHVTPRQTVAAPVVEEIDADQDEEKEDSHPSLLARPRRSEVDPIFAFLVVLALSIGLIPVEGAIRYVILWTALGGFGVATYILGSGQRLSDTSVENLQAGLLFGLGTGIPFVILAGSALSTVSARMFDVQDTPGYVMNTWVFMAVGFVMPAAESLFFRGALQELRGLLLAGILATLWSILLFFPHMELRNATGVAVVIAIFFTFLNFLYSYLRFRNGLAAAWICQIITGTLLWFAPRLLF
jgi:hypothetical protein